MTLQHCFGDICACKKVHECWLASRCTEFAMQKFKYAEPPSQPLKCAKQEPDHLELGVCSKCKSPRQVVLSVGLCERCIYDMIGKQLEHIDQEIIDDEIND